MKDDRAGAPGVGVLPGTTIRLWAVPVQDPPSGGPSGEEILTEEERLRAGRFRFQADRRRFAVGRRVLRLLLGIHLEAPPASIRLRTDPRGRPILSGPWREGDLDFNLSHSGDWVLVALARGGAVGVDVERHRSLPDMEAVARRSFSDEELAWFRSRPPGERSLAFYTCWTRKEAYIKAIGAGLAQPLRAFTVPLPPEGGQEAEEGPREFQESGRRWRLWGLTPAPGYAAAVVSDLQGGRLEARRWSGSGGITSWEET